MLPVSPASVATARPPTGRWRIGAHIPRRSVSKTANVCGGGGNVGSARNPRIRPVDDADACWLPLHRGGAIPVATAARPAGSLPTWSDSGDPPAAYGEPTRGSGPPDHARWVSRPFTHPGRVGPRRAGCRGQHVAPAGLGGGASRSPPGCPPRGGRGAPDGRLRRVPSCTHFSTTVRLSGNHW